ncbi:hypothetical protein A2752_00140 [Candidatus Uhrbacteria bacterium RIFCSPHIGHO2_01_FULL_46_23]|nr:MAG: hypothetical protein A2752_00140 [Candidatus Uhrbacteria bacterium RIFCSPHIGHO2_01_FULL_46_23]
MKRAALTGEPRSPAIRFNEAGRPHGRASLIYFERAALTGEPRSPAIRFNEAGRPHGRASLIYSLKSR